MESEALLVIATGSSASINLTYFLTELRAEVDREIIVVLPASANTLSAAALGLAGTPAQTALLAAPSPVLYFPHMNPVMWRKPAMQRHVAELRAQGDTVVAPVETTTYHMWKGAKDVGLSLPDPDEAAAIVRDWLLEPSAPAAPAGCAACGR